MDDKKPGLILTVSAMARLLIENLDRADCEAFAHAAAVIDAAAQTPGVPPHNVEQWQRAVALYNAALIEFPAHDATPEIPADWYEYTHAAEAYDEGPAPEQDPDHGEELAHLWAAWYGMDADETAVFAYGDILTDDPAPYDTQRKPRVTFEP